LPAVAAARALKKPLSRWKMMSAKVLSDVVPQNDIRALQEPGELKDIRAAQRWGED
jgi:hypothetical protein